MRTALVRSDEPSRATSGDDVEDRRLLAQVVAGDAAAFRGIVDRHLAATLGVARRMLHDETEAEDVAQETMLRLWRGARGIEVGAGGLRPWLRRVASNLCIDRIRSRRHVTTVEVMPEVPEAPLQMQGLSEQDLASRVEGALRLLPDRQRQALTLFHFEERSQSDVAKALGVSDEAVESLLARGRRALKAALKDEWRELLPDGDGSGSV